jgi:hypothetical protein
VSRGRAWPRIACAAREVFAKHASIKKLAGICQLVDGKKIMDDWPTSLGLIDGVWADRSQGWVR